MNETIMDCLTQRLNRLEKENRRMKQLAGLAVVGITALMLMGQATPVGVAKVLEAETFVVRDAKGAVRAVLRMLGDNPGLMLWDSNSNIRAILRVEDDGDASLRFIGKDKSQAVYLSNALVYHNMDGKLRVMLGQLDKQATVEGPFLRFFDTNGQPSASFVTSGDGSSLTFSGKDGNLKLALQTIDQGKPKIYLNHDGGETGVLLAADGLGLFDQDTKKPRAALLMLRERGPVMHLYDSTGKSIWGAP